MFRTVDDFSKAWGPCAAGTGKILRALTDGSLSQQVAQGHRDAGRIAWHIIQSIVEMAGRTGLEVAGPAETDPVPSDAATIAQAYTQAAEALARIVKKEWTDETLLVVDDMYGEKWPRGLTLAILIHHEIHHRGQLTILMRQAGLKVPGVYGPAKEEWSDYGMPEPGI